ncbi:MAG: glycosyltransferase family 4 protein, partial [Acidimicrobiales bacterium]
MSRARSRQAPGGARERVSAPPGTTLWIAPIFNFSGYGEEARGFVSALIGADLPIAVRSTGWDSAEMVAGLAATPTLARRLQAALNRPVDPPVTAVLHLTGDVLQPLPGAVSTVGRTMYETDGLPASWVLAMNTVDELWVPSAFNVETFRRAGVNAPLHVVPGGVDASAFHPRRRPLPVPGARGTVFLSVFEWSYRKGYDVLLRAWAEAFSPDDPVTLLLRVFPRSGWDGDASQIMDSVIDDFLGSLGTQRSDVAHIEVVNRALSLAEMPSLMNAADVYVSPSRGEGWGRPLLEAMSCGLPVIATRWSGNLEFMDDKNSLLLDINGLVDIDDRMDIPHYRGQRWADPSVAHLVHLMREAATSPVLRRQVGGRARADVEARWQWHQVANTAARRLVELSDQRSSTGKSRVSSARIRWVGDVYGDHSLAVVNRELCSRVASDHRLGIEVQTEERPPYVSANVAKLERVAGPGTLPGTGPVAVEVRHRWPPDLRPPDEGAWVMMQPWEFGGLPAEWIPAMRDQVDEVWVYTNWLKANYVRSGVPAERVAVVPLGVDTGVFRPEGERLELATQKSFRILFVGGAIARKGADLLLDSYLACFGPGHDVCLVVKPFGSDSVYRSSSMEGRIRQAAADPTLAAVEVIDGILSREEMAALYRACDVLVHPYRGEGFALPVAEAMACGLPVAVTGNGACLDYCDETTGWLIPAVEVPLSLEGFTPGPVGHWWAEPDAGALRDLLRHVATSPPELATKGAAAAQRVAERLSWSRSATIVSDRLSVLASVGKPFRDQSHLPPSTPEKEVQMSAMTDPPGPGSLEQTPSDAPGPPGLLPGTGEDGSRVRLEALAGLTSAALTEIKNVLDQVVVRV